MKKVCFIGSNGFLSTAFGKHFSDVEVYGTNSPKGYTYKHFTKFDILSTDYQFDSFLEFDIIFLFSALGVQSNVKYSTNEIYKVNTIFPIELFDFLSKNNFKGRLVTFGSYFEIGCNNEEIEFNEKNIINSEYKVPNDYCLTKRLLTKFIDSIIPKIKYWHFILPTIYGSDEDSNRLIPYIMNAISTKKEINLTSGLQVREYTHVDEIPKIVDKAIQSNLDPGIYNIPGQERLSIKELVLKILTYHNYALEKVKFGVSDRKDTDMMYLALNANKLHKNLNYSIKGAILEKTNDYLK